MENLFNYERWFKKMQIVFMKYIYQVFKHKLKYICSSLSPPTPIPTHSHTHTHTHTHIHTCTHTHAHIHTHTHAHTHTYMTKAMTGTRALLLPLRGLSIHSCLSFYSFLLPFLPIPPSHSYRPSLCLTISATYHYSLSLCTVYHLFSHLSTCTFCSLQ